MVGTVLYALITTSFGGNPPQVSVYTTKEGAIEALDTEIAQASANGYHTETYDETERSIFNGEGDEIILDFKIVPVEVRGE